MTQRGYRPESLLSVRSGVIGHTATPIRLLEGTIQMADQPNNDALLTPAEVAALFRVNPKTVTRWARAGKITAIRTLGGHRRFRASEIRRCLEQMEREGA